MAFASRSMRCFNSGLGRKMRGQNLDRDRAVEPCVLGAIHLAHAARA